MNFDLGAGNDRVMAEDSVAMAGLNVRGQSGNDVLAIADCEFGNLSFDAGSGNDSLYMFESEIEGRQLNGGSGYDTIYGQGSGAFGPPTAFNWEIIRYN